MTLNIMTLIIGIFIAFILSTLIFIGITLEQILKEFKIIRLMFMQRELDRVIDNEISKFRKPYIGIEIEKRCSCKKKDEKNV